MTDSITLVAILIFGFVAAHKLDEWLKRRVFLQSGVEYVLLGLLAGPLVTGALDDPGLARLDPLASLLTGLIGFQIGSTLSLGRVEGSKRGQRAAGLVFGMVALTVLGAATWATLTYLLPGLEFSRTGVDATTADGWLAALDTPEGRGRLLATLALAAAGLTASSYALQALAERLGAAGPIFDAAKQLARQTQVIAVVVFGISLSLGSHAPAEGIRELTTVEWVAVNLVLGSVLGVAFHFFIADDLDEHRLFLALVGVATFASGIAYFLHLSAIFMNLVVGFVLANIGGPVDYLRVALGRIEKPVFVLLLILAGALWRPPESPLVYALAAAFVLVRFPAIGLAGRAAAAQLGLSQSGSKRLGFTLMGQAPLTIAIAISYTLAVPDDASGVVLTAVLVSVILNDLWATFLARSVLDDAGEIPAPIAPDTPSEQEE